MHYVHHTSNRKTLPESFRRRFLSKSRMIFPTVCQKNFRYLIGTRLPRLTIASGRLRARTFVDLKRVQYAQIVVVGRFVYDFVVAISGTGVVLVK